MKNILIVAKKEIIDLLRDKRTLFTMLVLPLIVIPLIINGVGRFSATQAEKERTKTLKLGIVNQHDGDKLVEIIKTRKDITITKFQNVTAFDSLLKNGAIDGALIIDPGFDHNIDSMKTGNLELFYKSSNWSVKDRLMEIIGGYKSKLIGQRLSKLNIQATSIDPVEVTIQDVSTSREKFGKAVGGMLPYMFVIFSFMGCMFPAIDLFTNEKERSTLETLLTTPVSRLEILFGKMSVVSLIGLMTAILSIVGLSLGLKQFAKSLPEDILSSLSVFLVPSNILMILSMLLPLIIFFAGILTLITTYAKTYKEAQSIISPMTIIIILPAAMGLMPGVELTPITAIIPITNIALATKEIIAGTMNFLLYALVVGSLLVYAAISVFASVKWFSNESHIVKA